MRFTFAVVSIGVALSVPAGAAPIPNALRIANLAPACTFASDVGATASDPSLTAGDYSAEFDDVLEFDSADGPQTASSSGSTGSNTAMHPAPDPSVPVDANGNPIPLERQEPTRIWVSCPISGLSPAEKPHPPGWKYNFSVATHQATDYSSFIFLGLTSFMAEGMNEHPALGKGASGFYAYTWRGFLDKSDNTYLSAWLLPSLIHEDTRYYALGSGPQLFPFARFTSSAARRLPRTYGGRQTPNIAGLGGKVLTQVVSRTYYPTSATTFPVLAEQVRLLGDARRDLLVDSRVLS